MSVGNAEGIARGREVDLLPTFTIVRGLSLPNPDRLSVGSNLYPCAQRPAFLLATISHG